MDKEKFLKIMNLIDEADKRNDILYNAGINILEYCDTYHTIIGEFFEDALGAEGWDWVSYYLYEIPLFNKDDGDVYATRADGSNIYLRNVDELYEFLKEIGSV